MIAGVTDVIGDTRGWINLLEGPDADKSCWLPINQASFLFSEPSSAEW